MEKLYIHTEAAHNTRAAEVVVPIIMQLSSIQSVLDVGCGTGTWLKVFNEKFGIVDYVGLDGSYIDFKKLVIERSHFRETDLRMSFELSRKFDVALCLEVAEHLPDASADALVSSLCKHSNLIIFSAAIPGQGGQNHVNERWPAYWQEKFERFNFRRYDSVRPLIWNDERVDLWYRQNIFVFRKSEPGDDRVQQTLPDIHPAYWMQKVNLSERLSREVTEFERGNAGIQRSFKAFVNSLINKLSKR